ncbi:acyl-CoA dehydrogenase family protein [Aquabacterium sp.]|uniref:acyl-CoA dehydrogenase family protein n=1 Tax=Aquabacterium sp. TaxID=1872578 RepID=UPI0035B3948A
MNFELNDEQRALQDTLQRFAQRDYGFERRREILRGGGFSREAWRALADIGVLALNVPEAHGGLAAGDVSPVETLVAQQALGAALVVEPVLSSAVVATSLIAELADATMQARWLPELASGERIAVLAHFEPASRFDDARIATQLEPSGDGYVLTGRKAVVLHAGVADDLLVSALNGSGVSLLRVPRDAAGLVIKPYPTLDGQQAAEIELNGVALPPGALIGTVGQALPAIERALDFGLAALCAEAVGVMDATVAATVEYLKTRQQFGQPIGRFQALQHRMAEMLIHLEQARSMSLLATARCRDTDASARRRVLSAAKVVVGQACRFIGQQAVQLHGGMGMTDELIVSHYFKRLTAIELTLGDTDTHLQRFAALSNQ